MKAKPDSIKKFTVTILIQNSIQAQNESFKEVQNGGTEDWQVPP